ncbi:MAG: hypothetical protein ACLQUZ_02110 [Rhizomicrobium sp.]
MKVILRPQTKVMIIFAVVLSPMWLEAVWDIFRYGEYGAGLGLIGIALLLWAYGTGTVCIVATERFIEMRRFFRKEWRLQIDKLSIHEGIGGDIPILPAYILEQRNPHVGTEEPACSRRDRQACVSKRTCKRVVGIPGCPWRCSRTQVMTSGTNLPSHPQLTMAGPRAGHPAAARLRGEWPSSATRMPR